MRIASLNLTNFKGLWGRTNISRVNLDGSPAVIKEHHYYPFSDESKDDIEEALCKNTIYSNYIPEYGSDGYYEESVSMHKSLPFTKEQFETYQTVKRQLHKRQLYTKNIDQRKPV